MDLIYWDNYYNETLLLNLAVVIGLFTCLRLFSGLIGRMKPADELLKKDNTAFGISLAGVTFSVALILSGTIYGRPEDAPIYSAMTIALHGALGIVFLFITRLIFDYITFPKVQIRDEIVKGNIAVAIADTANVIAAALLIRAVLMWVSANSIEGLSVLWIGYLISQALLTGSTILRSRLFGAVNKGECIQQQLKEGNTALALRFAGHKISTAFAITIASNIIVSEVYDIIPVLTAWFLVSIVAIAVLKLISMCAEWVILYKIDRNKEVIEQRNIALGALEAAIAISIGMVLAAV
jgi:uncharacterized membrane protein YjfL (UPF0719 family)